MTPSIPHSMFSTIYNRHFFKGHVRAPHKDHLIHLSNLRHGDHLRKLVQRANPPPTWDSRTKNWIGPVKDQGQCGSCWDFSGTEVVEIAYYKAGVLPNDGSMALSEEYTLSCGRNGGCNGDDNTTVLEWAKATGLPTTKDYGAYQGRAGRCSYNSNMKLYKVDNWGFADSSQSQNVSSTEGIKAAIMAYGCVGAGIAADNSFMNNPAGTVFDRTTSQDIDHDIALIGWDDSKGSKGAWLLRNSWGTSWCDQGYIWIGYGVNNVGSEAVWAVVNASAPPIDWFA